VTHSWLASQKRRHVAALQSAPRAISEIRVIRGSLENLKKFSLNPLEGISTSDLNVQPSTGESATATTDHADRTDAQTQKEQVRFMKNTQNAVTAAVAPLRHCASHSEAATAGLLFPE